MQLKVKECTLKCTRLEEELHEKTITLATLNNINNTRPVVSQIYIEKTTHNSLTQTDGEYNGDSNMKNISHLNVSYLYIVIIHPDNTDLSLDTQYLGFY